MSIKNQYSHVFRFIPFSFFHLLGTSFSLAVFTTSLLFSLSFVPAHPLHPLTPSHPLI